MHFCVRDTGIGISWDRFQHIFEAFEQVDTSTTRQFGGTGLGLTITSELIRMMGGRIWVENQLGDHEANRQFAAEILRKRNHACVEAVDGKDDLEKYEQSAPQFDVILMDIQMSEMDEFRCSYPHHRADSARHEG